MLTRLNHLPCPAILSVRVKAEPALLAFVITPSPALARAVGDYLRETGRNISVVWFPSVAGACRRLEWQRADIVILDELAGTLADDAVDTLQNVAPDADVLLLAGGSAGS